MLLEEYFIISFENTLSFETKRKYDKNNVNSNDIQQDNSTNTILKLDKRKALIAKFSFNAFLNENEKLSLDQQKALVSFLKTP